MNVISTVSNLDNICRYVCGTVEEHAEVAREEYDAVVASEVLEHVNHPDLFIQTCAQIVKVRNVYCAVFSASVT